jgi:hypothetical protein
MPAGELGRQKLTGTDFGVRLVAACVTIRRRRRKFFRRHHLAAPKVRRSGNTAHALTEQGGAGNP